MLQAAVRAEEQWSEVQRPTRVLRFSILVGVGEWFSTVSGFGRSKVI